MVNQFEIYNYNPLEKAEFFLTKSTKIAAKRNSHLYVQLNDYGQGHARQANG